MLNDLPKMERPREKMLFYGAGSLSNAELIAIILSSGSRAESALGLAGRVLELESGSLAKLSLYMPEEFKTLSGIGDAKACSLVAALELGRRISSAPKEEKLRVCDNITIGRLFVNELRHLTKEVVRIAMLDSQKQLIAMSEISVGGLSAASAHPREVFAPAIKKGAAAVILAHNHPSGSAAPSEGDILTTKKLVESGKILGIELLDHIIVGDGYFVSLFEKHPSIFS